MLTVTLLGEQSVVDPATEHIRTRSVRTVALLGLLVARTGVPQSRASIAGSFWPDSGDAQALTNLRRELFTLRRLLGPDDDSLEVTSSHLCWHDRGRHRVDLSRFLAGCAAAEAAVDDEVVLRHGQAALALYGGDLLPGIDGEWLDEVRAELRSACTRLCDLVCEAALRSGRPEAAVEALRRRVTVEPYDEAAHRRLMEAQAGRGDRSGAIRTFHRLATLLERDLGVSPAPETSHALEQILGRGASQTRRPGPGPAALVGRTDELAQLTRTWERAASGQAHALVVYGGAGVGKSRLVKELQAHAGRSGAVVAVTRCFDTTGRLSLSPVADWLRTPAVRAARARLDAAWRLEVDRLTPVAASAGGPDPAPSHDVWQRHRFFEGVARALLAVGRPTLLVLDDAQWCDPDTLSLCGFLLNLAPEAPLLLAVTARSDAEAAAGQVAAWASVLRTRGILTEVPLGPLDPDRTAALARAVRGRPVGRDEATLLHEATGGFPLFVIEAARAAGEAPDAAGAGWHDILRRRLQLVSPAARETAGLAAALGRDFTLAVLVEASDLDTDTVVLAVDELWRHRIVRELEDGYDFSHDLLRQAAYALVPPARRWLLHRRLAQSLELVQASGSDAVAAAQVAEQYRLAGNPGRALGYYLQAADATARVFAHAEALVLLDSALEVLGSLPAGRSRDEQELRCLEASAPVMLALHGYTLPKLERTCERSVELAGLLGRPEQQVAAMVGLWSTVFVGGRLHEAYELATRAVALVRPGDRRFGQAHFAMAGSALHLGRPGLALEHFGLAHDSMSDEALSFGTRARVHTTAWWAHAALACGQPDLARELAEAALAEARASGHQYSYVVARAYAAITHQLLGERDACRTAAAEVTRLCDRMQFSYYGEWGRILEGWCLGGPDGVALARTGIGTLERQRALVRMPYWLSLLAEILPDRAAAERTRARADAEARRTREDWLRPATTRR